MTSSVVFHLGQVTFTRASVSHLEKEVPGLQVASVYVAAGHNSLLSHPQQTSLIKLLSSCGSQMWSQDLSQPRGSRSLRPSIKGRL